MVGSSSALASPVWSLSGQQAVRLQHGTEREVSVLHMPCLLMRFKGRKRHLSTMSNEMKVEVEVDR